MASTSLIARCADTSQNPKILFKYSGDDYTNRVLYINPITRKADLYPSYVQITLDNYDGTFDIFLTDQTALTEKIEILWGFGGVGASYTSNTITFHNNTPGPDTIEDSASQFIAEGFKAGMVITVADSLLNDGDFTIASLTAGEISLIATDSLNGDLSETELTMASEDTKLFTGYVEKVSNDFKEKTITLTCRDRLSLCLDRQIQSIVSDKVYAVYWNQLALGGDSRANEASVSEIIWDILTLYADLDDTESTANTDIDYASFTAWAAEVDGTDWDTYDIQVYCIGETCSKALTRICELTNSMIWVGGHGKIKFLTTLQTATGQDYTKALVNNATWDVDITKMINTIYASCAYNSAHDTWIIQDFYSYIVYGPMTEPYTYQIEHEHDRSFCHNSGDPGSLPDYADSQSALTYATEKFKKVGAPQRTWKLEMDTLGFLEDVGNTITLNDFFVASPYDEIAVVITEITYNIESWTCNIEGYYNWLAEELPS